jgi:hypothetical protein
MKVYKVFFKFFFVISFLISSSIGYGQVVINDSNFNAGWGTLWSGGTNSTLVSSSSLNSTQQVKISGGGVNSYITTNSINLSSYNAITISFDYRTEGYNNQDINIQFYNQYGNWVTIASFKEKHDFNDNTNYTETVEFLNGSLYSDPNKSFTANSKFRIISDTNKSNDYLYLDNIKIQKNYCTPINIGKSNIYITFQMFH